MKFVNKTHMSIRTSP